MNAANDVAVCAGCGEAFKLSEIMEDASDPAFDPLSPPAGAWFEQGVNGWTVGASTRSYMAFFLVPFMCIWSGGSHGGIYGTQFYFHKFTLILSLFGIPFLLGSILLGTAALMAIFGKVTLTIEYDEAMLFTGIGPIGWRRRFLFSDISRVEETTRWRGGQNTNGTTRVISLEGKRRVVFGNQLNEARRYFVVQCIRRMLGQQKRR